MSKTIRLPDAMPDVDKPTLLVVCDSHQCRLLDVGGHAIAEKELLESKKPNTPTDNPRTTVLHRLGRAA